MVAFPYPAVSPPRSNSSANQLMVSFVLHNYQEENSTCLPYIIRFKVVQQAWAHNRLVALRFCCYLNQNMVVFSLFRIKLILTIVKVKFRIFCNGFVFHILKRRIKFCMQHRDIRLCGTLDSFRLSTKTLKLQILGRIYSHNNLSEYHRVTPSTISLQRLYSILLGDDFRNNF